MGKNKLRKFAEMERLERVYQYPYGALQLGPCPLKGRWGREVFGNERPIVLELGCGKGEYTVGLARQDAERNFIGIDIKGARMYSGAKEADELGLANAAFLRTSIELLPEFFEPGEVSELWITFPDPQMKKATKRLTGTRFLDIYRRCLKDGGLVRLKTDSPFLYTYTREMLRASGLEPEADTPDLYGIEGKTLTPDDLERLEPVLPIPNMRTHYERQWLGRGLTIKYISFPLRATDTLVEPDVEIEPDTYRSYSRRSAEPKAVSGEGSKFEI